MTRSKARLLREWSEAQGHEEARAAFLAELTLDEQQLLLPGGLSHDASIPAQDPDTAPEGAPSEYPEDETGAAKASLVAIATEGELFAAPDGTAYATLPVGDHVETWRIRSEGFKDLLARTYYARTGKVPRTQQMSDAIVTVAGMARFDGVVHDVHLRVADHDGAIYIDLADPAWRAIEVTPTNWAVVDRPPVRFRRPRSMLELPVPERGGAIADLRGFVNTSDDESWMLLVAWLLFTMSPAGPYPIAVLHGEQGSAKTTAARLVRSLIDPNASPVRAAPKDVDDLMVACANGHVVALDNLSSITPWLSDALCRVATRSGLSKRMLYTDGEEHILDACRPQMLNGISDLATRGDLLDRALLIELAPIMPADRRTLHDVLEEFELVRPRILGAMLDVLVAVLRERPKLAATVGTLPRMADFALFMAAAEEALGWARDSFIRAYDENRRRAHGLALEASILAQPLRALLERHGEWTGTAEELRVALLDLAPDGTGRSRYWPSNAWAMSNALSRLSPDLRAVGIAVERTRRGGGNRERQIALRKTDGTEDSWSD
jgi:hypothetical protein